MSVPLTDSYRHRGLRRGLVQTLRAKGIADEAVLDAVGRVPRHLFFETAFQEHAYQDKAFPIGQGQTISQPYTVARQTELLQLQAGHRVLEVGTGSGYQACVLAALGARVFSVECVAALHRDAQRRLAPFPYTFRLHCGDGTLSWPAHAPYDAVIVTAGAPNVPDALLSQLKVGGRLVIPVGTAQSQQMVLLHKVSDQTVRQETFGLFRFVPLRGRGGWPV